MYPGTGTRVPLSNENPVLGEVKLNPQHYFTSAHFIHLVVLFNFKFKLNQWLGVLAQSPEPEAHDKVRDNNPDQLNWNWFLRRGGNRSTRRETSRSKDENQQQTQPT